MKLLLDIGNSRIKWAMLEDDQLRGADQIDHGPNPEATISELLDRCPLKPGQVRASNVAGAVLGDALAAAVAKRWSLPVEFAHAQAAAGAARNGYLDYRQLGVDRWLAILAAVERFGKAVCIVDAGTAVTIDQVDDQGQHLGGIIVPGLALMRRALTGNTGDLDRLADSSGRAEPPEALILGRGTDEAITGGAMSAIRGLIEACMQSARERWGDPALIVTGGDAQRIIAQIRMPAEHCPTLVLEGLALYVAD